MNCQHERTEAVYAYLHHASPVVGDAVLMANDGRPVARLCLDCDEQLHRGWGCPDCEWQTVEMRALCDPEPELLHSLTRPCPEHAEHAELRRGLVVPDAPGA